MPIELSETFVSPFTMRPMPPADPTDPTQLDQTTTILFSPDKLPGRRKSQAGLIIHGDDNPNRCRNHNAPVYRCQRTAMMTSSFPYSVGGSLAWNDASYVERLADQTLLDSVTQNKFAYVLGARQVGKSSLRVRTRHQLVQQGYRCVTIQANQLHDTFSSSGTGGKVAGGKIPGEQATGEQTTGEQTAEKNIAAKATGCASLISTIYADLKACELGPLFRWLKATADLSPVDRLDQFVNTWLMDVLLETPVVIFIDEIDALLTAALTADLFQWMARCYDLRATNALYRNLNFVILGSAIAADLPQPGSLFSAGCEILMTPFERQETYGLGLGFQQSLACPKILLDAIFDWAHGQPFLTQKLCGLMSRVMGTLVQPSVKPLVLSDASINQWVDETVRSHVIEDWQTKDDPIHLRAIGDRLKQSFNQKSLLSLYKKVLSEVPVLANGSYTQAELLLSGLVIEEDQQIRVANEIYRHVFALR